MTKEEKCSNTQKNRVVIHKSGEEKRVYKNELNYWLNEGWEKGWTENHQRNLSKSLEGKHKKISNSPSVETKEKIRNTLKRKYALGEIKVWNNGLTADTDERVANYVNKSFDTKIQKYGSVFPNNAMTEEHKRKIGEAIKGKSPKKLTKEQLEIKTTKQYLTRKKNDSFNKSKPEQELYEHLLKENKNKTIFRQYKDKKRYPFYCDFYIKEDDLFIELNAHWTHGGKPYDPNDVECQEQLKIWQEKAKTSKFYENAIITWTIRDVEKRECAIKNNLNYKVIY